MIGLHSGIDDEADIEGFSLDELAACIGLAIDLISAALRPDLDECDGGAELVVRRWFAHLDPDARGRLLSLVLSDRWTSQRDHVVRSILDDAGPSRRRAMA